MPANRVVESFYLGGASSIDQMNAATLYHPGDLGIRFSTADNKNWQIVQLDSGALSSATVGQVVYWKDKANYIVTNNNLFANGGTGATTTTAKSFVAGVIAPATVTAGYYTAIQQGGRHSALVTASITTVVGDSFVPHTVTGSATNASAGAGVAPPGPQIGIAVEASTATTHAADLTMVGIP
jgi:hypothetical protein